MFSQLALPPLSPIQVPYSEMRKNQPRAHEQANAAKTESQILCPHA